MRSQFTFLEFRILCSIAASFAIVACSAPSSEKLSAEGEVRISKLDVNMYPVTKTVCDPMDGGDPDTSSNVGLKAELFWLSPYQPRPTHVGDVIAQGKKSDRSLFFSQLMTPTRKFDKGFNNDLGDAVLDDTGEKLIEFFALRFKTVLRLAPDQEEGLYELALLADDGAVVRVRNANGQYEKILDNDGTHRTRLGCGSPLIDFKRDTEILTEIDYHQGPRFHLALIPLMRKAVLNSDGSIQRDQACGVEGSTKWFDDVTSEPKQPYIDLLARGWKPLTKDNYALPQDAIFNPCKDGETPLISNLLISERMSDGFIVTWNTNIPATSQVVATDLTTGEKILSTSDNVLRTSHRVTIQDLKPATGYGIQAVSISDSYGKGMTAAIYTSTTP